MVMKAGTRYQIQAFRPASQLFLPASPRTIGRRTYSTPILTRSFAATIDGQNKRGRKNPRSVERAKEANSLEPVILLEGSASGLPRVLLKRNRQSKIFRDGSQLVFPGSIDQTMPRSLRTGDLVQVEVPAERNDSSSSGESSGERNNQGNTQLIGWGVYNPDSLYRVRLLCHTLLHPELESEFSSQHLAEDPSGGGFPDIQTKILEKILSMNFQRSLQTRRALGLPSTATDTYRLVNGEGDSLSGMAVDVVGDKVAVIMSSAVWCEIHKKSILKTLQCFLPTHELIWKTTPSRLKQDGYEMDDGEDTDEDIDEKAPVICVENGVKYQNFPHRRGQKTSVYCDQRENRWNLAQLCSGKRVLDLCCYHGGFSLNAAKQGAKSVVGVDSSEDAIATCQANAALNSLLESPSTDVQFVKSEISDYMRSCEDKFDVVVLDPPKLAPSISSLTKASRKYHSLNRDALKLIDDDGGLLLTCTCSAAMTQKDGGNFFLQIVQQASLAAKRDVTLLRVSGAASCHVQSPINFPAGNYLTAALFMVHSKQA